MLRRDAPSSNKPNGPVPEALSESCGSAQAYTHSDRRVGGLGSVFTVNVALCEALTAGTR